ncbi:MAG TPA: hypothetical protein VH370_09945 [Humisphaera sp.]|nr:hypothetical protein [Humisphaera sp.]
MRRLLLLPVCALLLAVGSGCTYNYHHGGWGHHHHGGWDHDSGDGWGHHGHW